MVTTVEFEALFRAEQPKLIALGLAMVGDGEVAKELAQEALARAYQNWPSVSAYDVPGAWLRRVLINLVNDRGRRSLTEARALQRVQVEVVAAAGEPCDGAWRAAVRALPERQRAVIALHYLEDCSVDDVAAILGIAHGTVKATLARAKKSLRRALSGEDAR